MSIADICETVRSVRGPIKLMAIASILTGPPREPRLTVRLRLFVIRLTLLERALDCEVLNFKFAIQILKFHYNILDEFDKLIVYQVNDFSLC